MKIIVQAGGLGTRMKSLTTSKPKALIPVFNKPILFHLFDLFNEPSNEFIIIGDYMYDVLDNYLTTFAKDKRYILIKAQGKGNAAGIKEALRFVPDNEAVMLIWSDLIPPNNFKIDTSIPGCQVGVVDFPCSWCLVDNKLVHEKGDKNGVAGLYVFDNKSRLETLPTEGSFTTWLSQQNFPLSALSITDCRDVGTLQAYQSLDNTKFRCRPYNHIEVRDNEVVKTGLTDEAKIFIRREVAWYKLAQKLGFMDIPRLIHEEPMTLSRIKGQNLFLSTLSSDGRRAALTKMTDALAHLHSLSRVDANSWDLYTEYFTKTINRLISIAPALPFSGQETIIINGKSCINVLKRQEVLRSAVLNTLMDTYFTLYHGDCQLTNTLLDEHGNVFFIDPRGYFGQTKNLGDVRYDWVKVYYAIRGNFDQFNVKRFNLVLKDESVDFSISSGGWEFLESEFFKCIPKGEGSEKEIKLIHAIVWLSLASHAWEDFDSMCVAYYNGLVLFNDWLEEYK